MRGEQKTKRDALRSKKQMEELATNKMLLVFGAATVYLFLITIIRNNGWITGTERSTAATVFYGAVSLISLLLVPIGLVLYLSLIHISICLWSGVMELLRVSGATERLSRMIAPCLSKLFPAVSGDRPVMEKISANVSANILGLGNAATPLGMAAAEALGKRCAGGTASRELCNLVVLNTASLQLIPATIASVRSGLGAASPFDILPAVWIASVAALAAGLGVAFLCERCGGRARRRARHGKTGAKSCSGDVYKRQVTIP